MIDNKVQKDLRDRFNPEGSSLRQLQLNLLDILIEFDRICRANDINYWLDSGTLLGAARHGGFIPWDDDLDVCILKKDQRKLRKAMKKEVKPPFSFLDTNSDTAPRRWARLLDNHISVSRIVPKPDSKNETMLNKEHIWLDIFIETNGVPSTSRFIDKFYSRCFRRRYRLVNDGWIKHFTGVCLFPVAQFTVLTARICGRIFHPDSLIHDFGTGFYTQRFMHDIFPLGNMSFEGHMFYVPGNCSDYLEHLYGNWRELPETKESHNIQGIVDSDNVSN